MLIRPRRLRSSALVRELVAETQLNKEGLVYPYFVVPGTGIKQGIKSMPEIYHFSIDTLLADVAALLKLGLNKILLFGVGEDKKVDGSVAYQEDGLIPRAIKALRERFGNQLYIITDVCLCSYTQSGHCGVLHQDEVHNDETVKILARMALVHAKAGADMVAPSDMMDGRTLTIREVLDQHGFQNTSIMSYSIKFASAYYGPFREAADCAPGNGDRKTYQMDFRNPKEAMREAYLDEQEGADVLMIKPALAYLDIIQQLSERTELPIACYHVSGEYSMIKAAAQNGWINEQQLVMENMYAFRRAGAKIVITYHARQILENGWMT